MKTRFFLIIGTAISMQFIQSCKPDEPKIPNEDKTWDLSLNHSLKIGFSDTNMLFEKISKLAIGTKENPYVPNMIYYIDNLGNKMYDQYTILSTALFLQSNDSQYPYYYINIGGTGTPISVLSARGNKTWYIDWPKGTIDTLYADYYEDSKGPNACMCSFPLRELKLNGKPYLKKTNYDINGVYVFE